MTAKKEAEKHTYACTHTNNHTLIQALERFTVFQLAYAVMRKCL